MFAKNIICIEGGDFIGKSTLVEMISNRLGYTSYQSPGQTPVGLDCRNIIKSYKLPNPIQRMFFDISDMMFFQTEYQLDKKYVADRYWISRLVYQYYINQGKNKIEDDITDYLDSFKKNGILLPKKTIVLSTSDSNLLKERLKNSGRELDGIEKDSGGIENINSIYQIVSEYLINHGFSKNIKMIDVLNKSKEQVFEEANLYIENE